MIIWIAVTPDNLLQENNHEPHACMMSTISIEENNGKQQIDIDLWDGGNVYAEL